ncbi:MAG TPA: Gfo/Idh/MocA family oxidoreductase [Solirubrobacteraceae bacterium]|jgi:1,5-anhydro-D-fructose reductase (1,5-anhydro-D-mannitol-forming)
MISWGILGSGRVVDLWAAPAIAGDAGSVPLAIAGRNAKQASALAIRHGFERSYGSAEELLADPEIEAVYIATPNALHAEQVIACAAHGKHVLCEKPLGLTSEEAERAAEACAAAGVLLRTNFQYRHHPGLRLVRKLLAEEALTAPSILQMETGGAYELRGWRTDPSLAGMGATLNIGVHAYDLVEWLTGRRALGVAAVLGAPTGELETATLAVFELEGGMVASVNANQCAPRARADLHIDGHNGRISAIDCLRLGVDGEVRLIEADREMCWQTTGASMFRDAIASFVAAACAGERDPDAGGGLRSARIVDALLATVSDPSSEARVAQAREDEADRTLEARVAQ